MKGFKHMDQQQTVAPVDHGVLSSTGTVAVGTASGIFSSVGKTALYTIGGFALVGFLVGTGVFGAAFGLLAPVLGSSAGGVASTIFYTLGFGALGVGASVVAAPVAGLIGGSKGAMHSINRVSAEKGAANAVQAQVAAYKAQAQAEAAIASANAASAKYNFPAQGDAMNPASTKLFAANDNAYANDNALAHQGTVAAQHQVQQG